ncbi:hypothetical protein MCELHM10_01452 [Paracoccaceae bacterium]
MRKILAFFCAAALALTVAPAIALECKEPSFSRGYWWYEEQPGTYVLALGSFSDLKLVEATPTEITEEEMRAGRTVYSALFTGFRASTWAFDQPFTTNASLIFPDYGIYGGGYDSVGQAEGLPGTIGLVWFLQADQNFEATAELCDVIIDTDTANVKRALRCLRGGHCPKD